MSAYKYEVGKKYFIRTVTMILCGECTGDYLDVIVLKNASWVADTGRYQQALQSGNFSEVELYPSESEVIVGKGGLIDAFSPEFELPSKQK
jgi:hypothetical protein